MKHNSSLMGSAFGTSKTDAYLTPKEQLAQHITDIKSSVKGKHAPWEAPINKVLGSVHILNDDEYNMWKKGGY